MRINHNWIDLRTFSVNLKLNGSSHSSTNVHECAYLHTFPHICLNMHIWFIHRHEFAQICTSVHLLHRLAQICLDCNFAYICMHVHICIYICINVHICINLYECAYLHNFPHICLNMATFACIGMNLPRFACVHILAQICLDSIFFLL